MFDLPVAEKADRKQAVSFRNSLLDEGFRMAQFSVYYRLLAGKDAAKAMEQRIKKRIPPKGSVHILIITDKQYENLKVYESNEHRRLEKPNQLVLF